MQTLITDLRYGLRTMRKNPGFAAAAILILALGIGANTAIFSVVNALVLRPPPYPDSGRLVYVSEGNESLKSWGAASYPNFLDWKDQNQVFDRMAVLAPEPMNLAGGGEPERIPGLRVSQDALALLGVVPRLGRAFLVSDDAPGSQPVVLLSEAFWKRRFGADTGITGKTVILDATPHVIAGVLPSGFRLAPLLGFEPDAWVPVAAAGAGRGSRSLIVMARLKPGISIERAKADLNVVAERLAKQYPETNAGWKIHVDSLRGTVDPAAYALLAILIGSVLGIVCTNVSNLLLARASAREKELAVRAALGASRARLARQLFSEGMLLACAGTGLGVAAAFWACGLIRASAAGTNLELADVRPDIRVLGATVVFFLATAVAVALLPALRISSVDLNRSLRDGMSAASGASKKRFRAVLTAAEVMLSLVLLSGASLVIKSWTRLWQIDPGHRVEQLLTASISLPKTRYPSPGPQAVFFSSLLRRLEARGELESAGVVNAVPTWGPQVSFSIPGRGTPPVGEEPTAAYYSASPGYFRAMEIASKTGRVFTAEDSEASLQVALVNQALARNFWKERNPLGEQIVVAGTLRTIVGVIGDLRSVPLHKSPAPEIWVPFHQSPSGGMLLILHTRTGDPLRIASLVKQEVESLDPEQAVARIRSMDQVRMQDMGVILTGTRLLGILACGAMILAAVGIYGVLSHSVSSRTAEFGIRMAMGARRADVLVLVLGEGLRLASFGLLPGLMASLALGKVMASHLYGVRPAEPLILCGLILLLTAVSLLACWVPARKATGIDPIVALRCQ